jgi:hypothetical protein
MEPKESIERRALAWAASDDTGISSTAIFAQRLSLPQDLTWGSNHPSDGAGRTMG